MDRSNIKKSRNKNRKKNIGTCLVHFLLCNYRYTERGVQWSVDVDFIFLSPNARFHHFKMKNRKKDKIWAHISYKALGFQHSACEASIRPLFSPLSLSLSLFLLHTCFVLLVSSSSLSSSDEFCLMCCFLGRLPLSVLLVSFIYLLRFIFIINFVL